VTAITLRRPVLAAVSLALLVISLILLWAGHFFSWNDVEGTQFVEWNYGYGDLAALLAVTGALLSLFDRTARRLASVVVGTFVVFLLVAHAIAPEFAFVGSTDSFGIHAWAVVLAGATFVLLTPRWTRVREPWEPAAGRRRLTTWARWDLYLVALPPMGSAVLYVATALAVVGYPDCGQPGDACSQEYAGFFLGVVAVASMILAVIVAEIGTALARRHRRRFAVRS